MPYDDQPERLGHREPAPPRDGLAQPVDVGLRRGAEPGRRDVVQLDAHASGPVVPQQRAVQRTGAAMVADAVHLSADAEPHQVRVWRDDRLPVEQQLGVEQERREVPAPDGRHEDVGELGLRGGAGAVVRVADRPPDMGRAPARAAWTIRSSSVMSTQPSATAASTSARTC